MDMERLGVGFSLHPDLEFLELTRNIVENDADYFEINPEALWSSRDGKLTRTPYHELFRELHGKSGKPFVAHGLAFSLGTPLDTPEEKERTSQWLACLRADHRDFKFAWMTEHLGWVTSEGLHAVLPLPLPFTPEAVETVAERMRLLAEIVLDTGFENNVDYLHFGAPLDEPGFFNDICRTAPCGMLLDLHNAYTQCLNSRTDPLEYLDRIELENVLQIHISGGSNSESDWLPGGKVYRLDSHDDSVPEEVWTLAEKTIPKCPNLRGIVVERLNGTIDPGEVPALAAEVQRAKELFPC